MPRLKKFKINFCHEVSRTIKNIIRKKKKPIFHSPLSRFSLIVLTDKCLYLGRINESISDNLRFCLLI